MENLKRIQFLLPILCLVLLAGCQDSGSGTGDVGTNESEISQEAQTNVSNTAVSSPIDGVTMELLEYSDAGIVDITVEGANVRFEKGMSSSIETEYYGRASGVIYDLVTTMNENTYKITLNYVGSGVAPGIKEGGVIIKIPDDKFSLLCINGKTGSGIVLDDININTDITSESCAVIINNENGSHEISVDSSHDSYEISSVPISEDFNIKLEGSDVEFAFTEQPSDLKFQLKDINGYIELPQNWDRDFLMGPGSPKMTVEVINSIFLLTIDRDFRRDRDCTSDISVASGWNREGTVKLPVEDAAVIVDLLGGGNWTEGTSDCMNDCIIFMGGEEIQYHSDCGTINDTVNEKSLPLSKEQQAKVNAILGESIVLDAEVNAILEK